MPATFHNLLLRYADQILICPLFVVAAVYSNFDMCFVTSDYDHTTHEERETCCINIEPDPTLMDPLPRLPILFEVVGQIAMHQCFLTSEG